MLEKIVGTIPVKRLGQPSEIASIMAWLASEEGGYSTGRISWAMVVCTWAEISGSPKTNPAEAGFVVFVGVNDVGKAGIGAKAVFKD